METWAAVILAAGKGTRMRSKRAKALHEVCGRPMAAHVAEAARRAGIQRTAFIVGHQADAVKASMGDEHFYVTQEQQLGTGHALLQARAALERKVAHLLVLNGDLPLVNPQTLEAMMDAHSQRKPVMTLLTCDDAGIDGPGRVMRDADGNVTAIVEQADATQKQRDLSEVNVGAYCFEASWLWPSLDKLKPGRAGEVYLTDLVKQAHETGKSIETVKTVDPSEAIGVDTRVRLAQVDQFMRQRIREHWMLEGVTLEDPPTIYIDDGVEIGPDTVIRSHTTISGSTSIGEDCDIGPHSLIKDSTIGAGCRVLASMVESSVLEERVDMGPYSHLRPESYIEAGTHIGNFVEVKKSRLGAGSAVGHFSYLGDATIGRDVNIGAGTITVNYDGVEKLPTVVGEGAFLGCDSLLIAPVKIGAGAQTAAGAVVTRDVPPGTTVAGVPARPMKKGRKGGAAQARPNGKPPSTAPTRRKR